MNDSPYNDIDSIEQLTIDIVVQTRSLRFDSTTKLYWLLNIGYNQYTKDIFSIDHEYIFYKEENNYISLLEFEKKDGSYILSSIKNIVKGEIILSLLQENFEHLAIDSLIIDSADINNKPSTIIFNPYGHIENFYKNKEKISMFKNSRDDNLVSWTNFEEKDFVMKRCEIKNSNEIVAIFTIHKIPFSYAKLIEAFPQLIITLDNFRNFEDSINKETQNLIHAYFL